MVLMTAMSLLHWRAFSQEWNFVYTIYCTIWDPSKTTLDCQKSLTCVVWECICMRTEILPAHEKPRLSKPLLGRQRLVCMYQFSFQFISLIKPTLQLLHQKAFHPPIRSAFFSSCPGTLSYLESCYSEHVQSLLHKFWLASAVIPWILGHGT